MLADERQVLIQLATELHADMQAHNRRVNIMINKLLSEADALKLKALEGITTQPKVQPISIGYVEMSIPDPATMTTPAPVLEPGKRACSLCREPGHRKQNCPNAHKIQAAKKAEVAARPEKKTRGPVSPERRAQLAENLKKARAARKGKK